MRISELQAILKGDLSLIDQVSVHDVALYEDNIPVCPGDVEVMLKKYLFGDVGAHELTKWASFLCLRGEYGCPEQDFEHDEDHYEEMWDVIQALSTPEVDGEIDNKQAKQYLSELTKYKSKQE